MKRIARNRKNLIADVFARGVDADLTLTDEQRNAEYDRRVAELAEVQP